MKKKSVFSIAIYAIVLVVAFTLLLNLFTSNANIVPYSKVLEQFENWKNMPTAYAQYVKNGAPMPEMTKLENNLRVIAMLDAAKRSTLSGHYEPCNNLTWEI